MTFSLGTDTTTHWMMSRVTYWGQETMDTILGHSKSCSWMIFFVFCINCHWVLCLRGAINNSPSCIPTLALHRPGAIIWINGGLVCWRIYLLLGIGELSTDCHSCAIEYDCVSVGLPAIFCVRQQIWWQNLSNRPDEANHTWSQHISHIVIPLPTDVERHTCKHMVPVNGSVPRDSLSRYRQRNQRGFWHFTSNCAASFALSWHQSRLLHEFVYVKQPRWRKEQAVFAGLLHEHVSSTNIVCGTYMADAIKQNHTKSGSRCGWRRAWASELWFFVGHKTMIYAVRLSIFVCIVWNSTHIQFLLFSRSTCCFSGYALQRNSR